jgi:hypothetical protein
MDSSEANLVLWIELTLFLQLGSFATVFPRVTESWGLARPSLAGVACLGGAAGPGGSAGPSDAAGPTSWPWSIALVV